MTKVNAIRTALVFSAAFQFLAAHATASKLGDLANALPEKAFVKISGNTTLDDLKLESSIMYWTNSGVWDPVKKQVRWIGGPGSCCSDTPIFKMMVYDEALDTWTISPTPYTGTGHGYDGNAINPATGLHYFAQMNEKQVRVWNGTGFSLLPSVPLSDITTPSLTWFPEINSGAGGLLYMGNEGKLVWYNGSQWASIQGAQVTGYNNFSEYNPVDKVVWLGGNGGSYRLSANLSLTKLAAAPFNLEGNACALHSCDPVTGLYIVTNLANNTWWTFDVMADKWTQITGQTGKPDFGSGCNGDGNNQFQVPIPEYGVILYVDHNASPASAYLYKAAKSSKVAVNAPAPSRPGFAIQVTQDASGTNPIVSWTGESVPVQLNLFDLKGKRILSLKAEKSPVELNANGLPARVYWLKASAGSRTQYQKILLRD